MTQEPLIISDLVAIVQCLRTDVDIIRSSVIKTLSPEEQADILRKDRIQTVLEGNGPISMEGTAKIFLHIIPLVRESNVINTDDQTMHDQALKLYPING